MNIYSFFGGRNKTVKVIFDLLILNMDYSSCHVSVSCGGRGLKKLKSWFHLPFILE